MEQRDRPTGHGIDACQIWPLMDVATVACQRQVIRVIAPAMLSRDDVFDVE